MESTSPINQPKFSREVRLGLATYCGVSQAIYTGGVCQEFFRAVRGRGIYKLLKALVDADLVVDIVSGTSTSGINGVLLSYALTNSTVAETVDFAVFSEIWRTSGELYKLLLQPQPNGAVDVTCDGDGYFQQQLESALVTAFQRRVPSPVGEWVSQFSELDLFITGTDFWGKNYRALDDCGVITEVQDHRSLFHLKHRQGRKEPFNPLWPEISAAKPQHTYQALAKLCRLTSAMPMILPMVRVDLNDQSNLVDRHLANWGQLDRRYWQHRPEGKSLSFLDGGLLSNIPVAPLVQAMYKRIPERPTQRVMFYVDPLAQQLPNSPTVSAAMQEIPLSQSINNNWEQIQEHNHKVRRYQNLISEAEDNINTPTSAAELPIQKSIYLRSRLINLRSQSLSHLLRLSTGSDTNRRPELDRLSQLLINSRVSGDAKQQREQCLRDFMPQLAQLDVDYSLRQHFYLIHKIQAYSIASQSTTERLALANLSHQIGQSIKLLEVIKASLQKLFSNPVISDNFYAMLEVKKSDQFLRPLLYEYIFRLHRYLLDVQALPLLLPAQQEATPDVDGMAELSALFLGLPLAANESAENWLPAPQISSIWQQLQQKIEFLATAATYGQYLWNKDRFHYDQRGNQRFLSMLTQIESATIMLLHNSPTEIGRSLLPQFQQFEGIDRALYPLEYLTNLGEKEIISPVRIAPATAQMGFSQGKPARDKLSGSDLYATGGFFQQSWHENDLLWGRLDGLNRLMEGIINIETVQNFSGLVLRESARLAMTPLVYLELLLDESLPHINNSDRKRIAAHLTYLAQPNLQITSDKLRYIVNDLVLTSQRQILAENLNQVFKEEFQQERTRGSSSALIHDPLKSSMMKMARQITKESLGDLLVEREQFFRRQYLVGSERLYETIPGMLWVNIATRSVLLFRDLLFSLSGHKLSYLGHGNQINRVVDRFLHGCYWWLQLQGTQYAVKRAIHPHGWWQQVALALLAIGLIFWAKWSYWWYLAVAIIIGWGWFKQYYRQRRRSLKV